MAAAARLCYSPDSADVLLENLTGKNCTVLDKLVEMGHLSPIEHVSFAFAVGVSGLSSDGAPRGSYSQSRSYVTEDAFEYIVPPSVAANEETALYGANGKIRQLTSFAPVVHQEDARYVLPNACETKLFYHECAVCVS